MTEVAFTRCARPHVTARRISTYTVLGFTGYVIANAIGVVLASHWDLSLGERLVAFFAPPVAFIVVVTLPMSTETSTESTLLRAAEDEGRRVFMRLQRGLSPKPSSTARRTRRRERL